MLRAYLLFFSIAQSIYGYEEPFTTTLEPLQVSSILASNNRLVVVSLDGFRHDYVKPYDTPNLDTIAAHGVYAPNGYIPAFLTKTFPTHWTIATGLHQESHGIIDNRFFDFNFNSSFTMKSVNKEWYGGEPIWTTCKRNKKTAGALFWPGSMVENDEMSPDFTLAYDSSLDFDRRVELLMLWLDSNVDLSMIYFHQPDKNGHKYGAFSMQLKEAVENADRLVGKIWKRIRENPKYDNVNIIILSDHGMTNLTTTDVMVLSDLIDLDDIHTVTQSGPVAGIVPKPGKADKIYQILKQFGHPNVTVYKREEIPERFHYKNNQRVAPIVLMADEGYLIDTGSWKIADFMKEKRRFGPQHGSNHTKIGGHGYDNSLPSMRPIFYAEGPIFKKNYTKDPFDAVDLYSMFCHILDIQPAPNNGSLSNLVDIMVDKKTCEPLP